MPEKIKVGDKVICIANPKPGIKIGAGYKAGRKFTVGEITEYIIEIEQDKNTVRILWPRTAHGENTHGVYEESVKRLDDPVDKLFNKLKKEVKKK